MRRSALVMVLLVSMAMGCNGVDPDAEPLSKMSSALCGVTCPAGSHAVGYYCDAINCTGSCSTNYNSVTCQTDTGSSFTSCGGCSNPAYPATSGPVNDAQCATGPGTTVGPLYTCSLRNLKSIDVPLGPTNGISGHNLPQGTVTLWQTSSTPTVIPLSVVTAPPGTIILPASATVPANSLSTTFTVNVAASLSIDTSVIISASDPDDTTITKTDQFTVLATPALATNGITVTPSPINSGLDATVTITLQGAAPVGGAWVQLQSTDATAAPIPAFVRVPANQSSYQFTFTTGPVPGPGSSTVTLSATTTIGAAQSTTLTINPALPPTPILPCPIGGLLPPGDEVSSGQVDLPFVANFFGARFSYLFVNNNGNMTFGGPLEDYSPYHLAGAATPIIAPFFADVETSGGAGGTVSYGIASYSNPNDSLCVTWDNVGYYDGHSDKLDKFQVLLVDQSAAPGGYPGDFDIMMNYEKIQWETGDLSGGIGGVGGQSAVVGYSDARGHSQEVTGSLVPGSFLDTSGTSLASHSQNSTVPGRWIYHVHAGTAPAPSGTLVGLVTSGLTPSVGPPLVGAPVQVCTVTAPVSCVFLTKTGNNGRYVASGLPAGKYIVTAYPPANLDLVVTNSPQVQITAGVTTQVDIALPSAVGIPPGTSIEPYRSLTNGVPTVHYQDTLTLRATGCVGGTAVYTITADPRFPVLHGPMTEDPPGEYSAYVGQLYPTHGAAKVEIDITCKLIPQKPITFDLYIDPSGRVLTPAGIPVFGATVTLLRSDTAAGPFLIVPDGSAIMSPGNRSNPSYASVDGQFGWDVVTGYYVVRASRSGCTSTSGGPYAESAVLTIPPAVIDLDLRLECPDLDDTTPPVSQALILPGPNASGWSQDPESVTITATDDLSGVKEITYALSGAQTGGATVAGNEARFMVSAEGVTTLTWYARDQVGNVEKAHTLEIRIDHSGPTLSCSATPAVLSPPNHRMIPIHVDVELTDSGSGPGSFSLVSVTSDEPDDGSGDGHTDSDIQGWDLGTADVDGLLRAERSGHFNGRTYRLTYQGTDQVGHSATCSTTVFVPKDE